MKGQLNPDVYVFQPELLHRRSNQVGMTFSRFTLEHGVHKSILLFTLADVLFSDGVGIYENYGVLTSPKSYLYTMPLIKFHF